MQLLLERFLALYNAQISGAALAASDCICLLCGICNHAISDWL